MLGLELRQLYPGLTDKWYNILPVDLSEEAIYTVPLIASNLYFIGTATITVEDGQVTVDYLYNGVPRYVNNIPLSECVAWFTDADDITAEFINNPSKLY